MSVQLSAWDNISAPAGWIFMKFDIRVFIENMSVLQSFTKIWQNSRYFTWRTIHFLFYLSVLHGMRVVLDKSCREDQKHILCTLTMFKNSCRSWDNVGKYCRAKRATGDSKVHVHCMLIRLQTQWLQEYACMSCTLPVGGICNLLAKSEMFLLKSRCFWGNMVS
jgi:hypothetical protein